MTAYDILLDRLTKLQQWDMLSSDSWLADAQWAKQQVNEAIEQVDKVRAEAYENGRRSCNYGYPRDVLDMD